MINFGYVSIFEMNSVKWFGGKLCLKFNEEKD